MCLPFDPKRVDEFDPIGAPKLDDVILGANGNAKGNSSKHPACTALSLSLTHTPTPLLHIHSGVQESPLMKESLRVFRQFIRGVNIAEETARKRVKREAGTMEW